MELYQIIIFIAIVLENVYIFNFKKSSVDWRRRVFFVGLFLVAIYEIFFTDTGAIQNGVVLKNMVRWICYIVGNYGIICYVYSISNALMKSHRV